MRGVFESQGGGERCAGLHAGAQGDEGSLDLILRPSRGGRNDQEQEKGRQTNAHGEKGSESLGRRNGGRLFPKTGRDWLTGQTRER